MENQQQVDAIELPPEISKQLTGLGDRFLAVLIDTLIWLFPFIFVFVSLIVYAFEIGWAMWFAAAMVLLTISSFIVILVFHIILVIKRSQSIGKYLMDIYVYDLTIKKRMEFWKYALLRKVVCKEIIPAVPFFGFFYTVIDIIFVFRRDHRTLHDHMAESVVLDLEESKKRKKFFDFSELA